MGAGSKSEPLSDDELAALRRQDRDADPPPWGDATGLTGKNVRFAQAARNALPQLLDEVVHSRTIRRLVGACPPEHGMEHAAYCGGCCAQFDPGRMVLVHETRCRFRGHERAER